MQETTSKMSHNNTVTIDVRPLWGRTAGPLVPRPYVLTTKKDETFLGLISFVIPANWLRRSLPLPRANHTKKTLEERKQVFFLERFLCDSGGIQTHNLLIRSQMLYSVELRNPFRCKRVQR